MEVKLELLLTRTVTVHVADRDIDDQNRLVQLLQTQNEEQIHSVKMIEVNGRHVGTSLDCGSALEVNKDQIF